MSLITKQIRYALEDIYTNKKGNLILFVQVIVALFFFSYVLTLIFRINTFQNKVTDINNKGNMYIMYNVTDEDIFSSKIYYQKDVLERGKKLYDYLNENINFKAFTSIEDNIKIDNKSVDIVQVNKNFFDIFQLKCCQGEMFNEFHYTSNDNIIPVILGNKWLSKYNLGDIIDSKYKVIGFLEPKSWYFQMKLGELIFDLDTHMLLPIQTKKYTSITDYDLAIHKTYIMSSDKKYLLKIQEKSSELNLFSFKFKSFEDVLNNFVNEIEEHTQSIIFFLIIILIFAVIGIVSNLFQFINQHMHEFIIHLFCGANIFDLMIRIFLQVGIMIIIADSFIVAIFKYSRITLLTLIFSIFIIIVVILIPCIRMYRLNIVTQMRRN